MNSIDNKNFWQGVPEELTLTCMCSKRVNSHDQVGYVLEYLKKHMNKGSFFNGVEPYEAVHFTARAIEYTLFPLEFHFYEDWNEYAEDISQILDRHKELTQLAESDNCQEWIHTDELRQKWNIFKSVLLMVYEEWGALEKQLERVLQDTRDNVEDLLNSEEAERYAIEDDGNEEYHYPMLWKDTILPINWLAKERLPVKAKRIFARIYEKYCLFLVELGNNTLCSEVVRILRKNAEKHLQKLCLAVLDEAEINPETPREEVLDLSKVKECFEKMLSSNRERSIALARETEGSQPDSEGNKVADENTYLQKWGRFTNHLYELMTENRGLPVVVPYQMFNDDGSLECSTVNIRDYKTGKIKEKVILIHNANENIEETIDDYEIKLPFS